MMIRTIQHPGVQIQETEIGSYSNTIVMNNAYLMGFTDRGPIYNYSFISSTREFTKIYGEPQTEAEKYLFTAVQSILANGGTPIVARMPYDNKQCKAYKALKMKWMDKTDLINPKIKTDLASPLVPLSTLTKEINMDKSFNEIFSYDNVTIDNKNSYDVVDATGVPVVDTITIPQAIMLLNPYEKGDAKSNGKIYNNIKHLTTLKINGVSPSSLGVDQIAVSSLVNSINGISNTRYLRAYKYNAALNTVNYNNVDEVKSRFINDNCLVGEIKNRFIKVDELGHKIGGQPNVDNDNKVIDIISKEKWFDSITSGAYLISLYKNYEEGTVLSGYPVLNKDNLPNNVCMQLKDRFAKNIGSDQMIECLKTDKTSKRGAIEFGSYKAFSNFCSHLNDDSTIVETGVAVFSLINDETECFYDFTTSKSYIVKPSIDRKPVYSISNGNLIRDILERAFVLAPEGNDELAGNDYSKVNGVINKERFAGSFGNIPETLETYVSDNQVSAVGKAPSNSVLEEVSNRNTQYIDQLIPLFKNTVNGFIVENGKITNKRITPDIIENDSDNHFELLGFVQLDNSAPAISGIIDVEDISDNYAYLVNMTEITNVYSSDLGIHSHTKEGISWLSNGTKFYCLDKTLTSGIGKFSLSTLKDFIGEGTVTINDFSWDLPYTYSIEDTYIKDVDDNLLIEFDWLVKLKAIYNNSLFLNFNEDQYTSLEAKIMETPEMGFKYGLYLDSEDCEISNDQYDDLVTVNQFKAVDRTIDKYGQDIDDANFVIVDKQKTVVQGNGGNVGFFTTIIDPYDALKVQRTLISPANVDPSIKEVKTTTKSRTYTFDHSESNIHELGYWAYESNNSWNSVYDSLLDSMDCLQKVRNADGIYIGDPNPVNGKLNIFDSWSVPLTGNYYEESISKTLMKKFPTISMADISSMDIENPDYTPSIIDHNYATHICVAVCKTTIDQSNGKIIVNIIETHFGSLFDETNMQNGRSVFIGDIINRNSEYIEFYRNDYVSAGDAGAYDPPEYRRTDINQIFIKDSDALRNAAALRGIDYEDYGCDALDPEIKAKHEAEYYSDLHKYHIFEIDKKEVCIYNLHWEANLTSFSKKESQKVIANTSGLYSVQDGTTINVASNFIIDMDRCIKFIKNVDAIQLHFVCDAGLSTIAQFCDNVIWNPRKKTVVNEKVDPVTHRKTGEKIYETTGGWITQPFDPDNDPDGEDRYITTYEDVSTWRKVVEKLASIGSEIRKDCFVIIDAPRHLTLDGAAPKIRQSKFTNNFDKAIGKCLRYISGINNSYVAGYYNWLRTTDPYTGKSIWIPPTSKIIGNYCYLNISNLPWLAPAGLSYGLISGCHGVSHNPDPQEEDQIYMKSWNYVKQYPFEGLVVEGQRTLLGKESVFERVNVRLLFLDLERYAYNVSRTFKYQVNNSYTREQFVATLKPKFEDYTLRGGMYEYMIKVDETNNTPETIDANELRGDIFIKPARLIEFILLNFVGTSTGVDFTELQLG